MILSQAEQYYHLLNDSIVSLVYPTTDPMLLQYLVSTQQSNQIAHLYTCIKVRITLQTEKTNTTVKNKTKAFNALPVVLASLKRIALSVCDISVFLKAKKISSVFSTRCMSNMYKRQKIYLCIKNYSICSLYVVI